MPQQFFECVMDQCPPRLDAGGLLTLGHEGVIENNVRAAHFNHLPSIHIIWQNHVYVKDRYPPFGVICAIAAGRASARGEIALPPWSC